MSERHCVLLTCNRNHLKYALFVAWQLESNVRRDFDIVIASDEGDLESSLPDYIKFLHLTDVHICKASRGTIAFHTIPIFAYLLLKFFQKRIAKSYILIQTSSSQQRRCTKYSALG